jgi:hypothetical protein
MSARYNSQAGRPAAGLTVPGVDISRLVYDSASAFNPLHPGCLVDYHVSAPRDGFVMVTVALPDGMLRAFVTLLDSLTGLVRFIDHKGRSAASSARAIDLDTVAERERVGLEIRATVEKVFDGHIETGASVLDALKWTNRDLKAQGHRWASYHVVQGLLSPSGRLRKKRR